jgi:FtsZ-binding cell division protein ZapB
MSSDNIERRIEFIIEQQAKFSTDIEQLKERQTVLTDALLSLTHVVERHADQIAALTQQGKATDERLNVLVGLFERHTTEGHKAH